ncbi:MAG: hypothetical protein EPGJADBJ_05403 [Saprospiraceae bacterium]|nr:hypothetical protein [Saprospiraceae bacterium]
MASFPVETVREILAQNKQGIEPEVDLNMVAAPAGPEEKAPDYENVVGQDDLTRFDQKMRSRGTARRGGKKRKSADRLPGPKPKADGAGGEVRQAAPRKEGARDGRGGRRGRRDRGPRNDKPGTPPAAQPPQA